MQMGAIVDQTQLLQDIKDGLLVYSKTVDPVIAMFSEDTIRQVLRVSQAPKTFTRDADGGTPESQRMIYRLLNIPFNDFSVGSQFTVKWLQDALPSDIYNEVDGAMRGDVELQNSLFFQACMTKMTAGSIGTAYQASFYNGETDVPPYKNTTFSSAHYHYWGLNTTTVALSHIQTMKATIQEHGFGLTPNSLHLWINSAQVPAIEALVNSQTGMLQAWTPERQKALDLGIVGTAFVLDGVLIHVDDNIPAGYMLMLCSDVKPISRRLHFKPEFQGLTTDNKINNPEYPLAGLTFLRRVGFAPQYLAAGCAVQIVASTTYTNPTWRIGS